MVRGQVAIDLDEEQNSTSSDFIRAGSAATSSQDLPAATIVLLDDAQPRSSALLAAAETVRRPDGIGVWRRTSSSSGAPRALNADAAALQQSLRERWARYAATEASAAM